METFDDLSDFVRKNFGSRIDLNCGLGFFKEMKSFPYISSTELIIFTKTHLEKGTFLGKFDESFVISFVEKEMRRVLEVDDLLKKVYFQV